MGSGPFIGVYFLSCKYQGSDSIGAGLVGAGPDPIGGELEKQEDYT